MSIFASLPEADRAWLCAELRVALPDVVYRTPFETEAWWTRPG